MHEINTHQDQKYVEALLSNDDQLLREIYDRFSHRIMSLILKNQGSKDDAQDIMQEGLLEIYRQARDKKLVLTCPFEAYLYLICRGKWLNVLKKRSRSKVTFKDLEGFKHIEAAEKLYAEKEIDQEREALFRQYFLRLRNSCQEILELTWSGLNMIQIAERLKISHTAARQRKFKCTNTLLRLIQSDPDYSALTR